MSEEFRFTLKRRRTFGGSFNIPFEEHEHPRWPKGDERGGQFRPKTGAGMGSQGARNREDRSDRDREEGVYEAPRYMTPEELERKHGTEAMNKAREFYAPDSVEVRVDEVDAGQRYDADQVERMRNSTMKQYRKEFGVDMDVEDQNFEEVREFELWGKFLYPHIEFDYSRSGMQPESAAKQIQEFVNMAQAFPEVAKRMGYVGTRNPVPYSWGHASPGLGSRGGEIVSNPRSYNDPVQAMDNRTLETTLNMSNPRSPLPSKPKGTPMVEATMTHEWGHQLDFFLSGYLHGGQAPGSGQHAAWGAKLNEWKERADDIINRARDRRDFPSGYAEDVFPAEMWAEGARAAFWQDDDQKSQFTREWEEFLYDISDAMHDGEFDFANLNDLDSPFSGPVRPETSYADLND